MSSTREKLISLLSDQGEKFVSGQKLSDQLGVSRTAVWKQIKQLEEDGYKFEALPSKGYRLLLQPEKVSENTLYWGLETDWLGKPLEHYPVLDSTQRLAKDKAQEGAQEGLVIVADQQTAGIGRRQKKWYSEHSDGIWFSFILRPKLIPTVAPQLTLLTSVVTAKTIEVITNLKAEIKWPNDLILNDKKVAGILTEMQAEHDQIHYLVIGVGINVNQQQRELDSEIKNLATSLRIESDQTYHKRLIIQEFLSIFEKYYQSYLETGFEQIRLEWLQSAYRLGEVMSYTVGGVEKSGVYKGIDKNGALIVEDEQGRVKNIYSAEINWFREDRI